MKRLFHDTKNTDQVADKQRNTQLELSVDKREGGNLGSQLGVVQVPLDLKFQLSGDVSGHEDGKSNFQGVMKLSFDPHRN